MKRLELFFFYTALVAFCVLGVGSCTKPGERKLPALNENYRKNDKNPFGTFVAYHHFKRLFGDRYVEDISVPFDGVWRKIRPNSSDKNYSLYFLITKNLVLTYTDVKALLDYVRAGNDLFISADYIDSRLLENIGCYTERQEEIAGELKGNMKQTHVSMYFGENFSAPEYGYYYFPFLNSFSNYDPAFTRVLGVSEANNPNYVVLFSGKGRIYLHAAPRVFGNYFLLTRDNYRYFENVISYLRSDPRYIYWDEYYKSSGSSRRRNNNNAARDDSFSTLGVISQNPSLLWAFRIAVAGLLLFILFNVKRKQRIIPIKKPQVNSTVAFAETIGRLYLQKKNNRHIADKMITYFLEKIRTKYFISTAKFDDEFLVSLAGKSGNSKEKVTQLFSLIQEIQSANKVEDPSLLKLNSEIENFTKTTADGK